MIIVRYLLAIIFVLGFVSQSQATSDLTEVSLNTTPQTNDDNSHQVTSTPANQPFFITVSLKNQQINTYEGLNQTSRSRASSGKKGYDTPSGIYSILEKRRHHRSNIYSNAPMPYMQRLTWSGIALHQSNHVPDYAASHGCVRLPAKFAKELFQISKYRAHVIIAPEEVTPRLIRHSTLFQPKASDELSSELRATVSDVQLASLDTTTITKTEEYPLRIYITRATKREQTMQVQKMLAELGYYTDEIDGLYGRETIKAVKKYQIDTGFPTSGIVSGNLLEYLQSQTGSNSLPDGKLYVRQAYEPVMEAPVKFKDPQKPLGTHLFLATNYSENSTDWISLGMSSRVSKSIVKKYDLDVDETRKVRTSSIDVLNRIIIPDETREQIESMLNEGSSFAVSDNGMGTETGKGTDFIVQTGF